MIRVNTTWGLSLVCSLVSLNGLFAQNVCQDNLPITVFQTFHESSCPPGTHCGTGAGFGPTWTGSGMAFGSCTEIVYQGCIPTGLACFRPVQPDTRLPITRDATIIPSPINLNPSQVSPSRDKPLINAQPSLGTLKDVADNGTGCVGIIPAGASPGVYQYYQDGVLVHSRQVFAAFTASIGGNTTLCSGSTTLSALCDGGACGALGSPVYSWSTGANTASINVNTPGVYSVTIRNGGGTGCQRTASVTVVSGSVSANISGPSSICIGQGTTLTASGGGTYLWSTGANTPDITISPSTTTDYTVTVTNGGCTGTATRTLNVNANPTPNISPGTATICAGQSTTLTASGGTNYNWNTGATTPDINVSPGTTTNYSVTVTNGVTGCSASTSRTVTVNSTPTPNISPGTATICAGQSTTLTASGGGTYAWSTGANTADITVSPGSTTNYTVTVTSGGCSASTSRTVTVNALPTPSISPGTAGVCPGNSTTLTASGGSSYAWNTGANTAAITVSPGSTTSYTVTVTSSGCSASTSRTVTVFAAPSAAATNTGPYTVGQTIQLNGSGGGVGATFNWSGPNSFGTSVQNPTRASASLADAGVYNLTVTSADGCTVTASTNVVVSSVVVASASNTGPYCNGVGNIQLNASGGTIYNWSGPGGFTSTLANPTRPATVANAGVYTVTVSDGATQDVASTTVVVNVIPNGSATDNGPVCVGSTIELLVNSPSAGVNFSWSGPGGFTSTLQTPTRTSATPAMGGVYNLTVTDPSTGCVRITNTTVGINSAPSASASNTGAYCDGQGVIELSASGGTSYNWSGPNGFSNTTNSPTRPVVLANAGTYTVTVTNGNGCTATANTTVVVNAIPNASISGPTSTCTGGTVTLTASPAGGLYTWSPGGQATASITETLTANRTYTVSVVQNGCVGVSSAFTVTVTGSLTPTFSNPSPFVCSAPTLNANPTLSTVDSYLAYSWSNGATTPTITVSNAGTYTVSVTATGGCLGSASVNVVTAQTPSVNVSFSLATVCENQNTTVTAACTGNCAGVTYTWNQGLGAGPTHVTSKAVGGMGYDYEVTLTATNGCAVEGAAGLLVNPSPNVTASNTGSPYCLGELIQFSGSGAQSYSWSGPSSFSSTGVAPSRPGATAAMAGVYSVTGTDANGCTATAQTTVDIDIPAVGITPSLTSTCVGGNVTLTAANTAGLGPFTYVWNQSLGSGAVQNINPTATTTYVVTMNTVNGCTATNQVTITVGSSITPSFAGGSNQVFCESGTLGLAGVYSTYNWGALGSSPNINLSAGTYGYNTTQTFSVTATDAAGCVGSNTATITFAGNPVVQINRPDTTCAFSTLALTGSCTGSHCSSPFTYQWSNGQSTANATFNNGSFNTNTTYTLVVGNSFGCTASLSGSARVQADINLSLTTPVDSMCPGDTAILTRQFSGVAPNQYFWTAPFTHPSSATDTTVYAPGTYTVVAQTSWGCRDTATRTILSKAGSSCVQPTPPFLVIIPGDTSFCHGQSVSIRVDSVPAGATYLWNSGGHTGPMLTRSLTQDTSYRVTVSLSGSPIAVLETPILRVKPANINLTLSNTALCSTQPTATATLNASPAALCAGCTIEVLNGLNQVVATRNTLPSTVTLNQQGNYYARILGCNQISPVRSLDTTVLNLSLISAPGDSVCAGTPVDFIASANCSSCNYAWSTGQSGANNQIQVSAAGPYSVTVTQNGTGCSATASRTIVSTQVVFDTLVLMPIAFGTVNIPLDSLYDVATPASALTRPLEFIGQGIVGSLGTGYTFTPPASAVGGLHPILVRSYQGSCFAERTMHIPVLPSPTLRGLVRQYCPSSPTDSLLRDLAYTADSTITPTRRVFRRRMTASATNYNGQPLVVLNPQGSPDPQLQFFAFNPALINAPGNFSVLTVTYRTIVETYSGGVLTGSRSYTVGTYTDTVFSVTNLSAQVLTTDTLFCRNNNFEQFNFTPGGGNLTVRRLNGLRSGFDTSFAVTSTGEAFLNPSQLYANESSDLRLRLTYTVGTGICAVNDLLEIRIPAPANTNFFTTKYPNAALRRRDYCVGEASDLMTPSNIVVPGIFTVNGSLANPPLFNPTTPGQFLVSYTASNSFGCSSSRVDTFVVNNLPGVSLTSGIPNSLCVYDAAVPVEGLPVGGQMTLSTRLQGSANPANPFVLNPVALLGTSVVSDTALISYQITDPVTGCVNTAQRFVFLHPRPVLSMTPLAATYCAPSPAIELNPSPAGGTLSALVLSTGLPSSSGNLNATTQRYTPNTATSGEEVIRYSYTNPLTSCINTLLDTTRVIPGVINTNFAQPLPTETCFTGDTLLVLGSTNNSIPALGFNAFSSNKPTALIRQAKGSNPAAPDSAWIVPNLADTGLLSVFYTFNNGTCSRTISSTVRIRPLPELSFGYTIPTLLRSSLHPGAGDTLCFNRNDSVRILVYDASSGFGGPVGGVDLQLSGTRVSGEFFLPDSVGNNLILATYTNFYRCVASAIDTVHVLSNPEPVISGLNPVYCTGAPLDTVLGVPQGGVWRILSGGLSYADTGNIINSPSAQLIVQPNRALLNVLNPGNSVLRYEFAHLNTGCTNRTAQSFAVNTPVSPIIHIVRNGVSVQANTAGPLCQNSAPLPLEAYVNNQYVPRSSGQFYEVNRTNGVINDTAFVASLIHGARTVVYEYTDPSGGCNNRDTVVLLVEQAPTALVNGLDSSYCIDYAPATLNNGSLSSIGPAIAQFNLLTAPTALSSITANSYSFDPAQAGVGQHQLQVIAESGISNCRDTAIFHFVVRGLPLGVAIDDRDTLLCGNELAQTVQAFPTLATGTVGLFELWRNGVKVDSSVGSSNSFTLRPAQYIQQGLGYGDYQLSFEYRDPNACANFDTLSFSLQAPPSASFVQTGFCIGDSVRLQSSSTIPTTPFPNDTLAEWIWSYQGRTFGTVTQDWLSLDEEPLGWGIAQLIVRSGAGCVDTIRSGLGADTVFIYNKPRVDFSGFGGCQGDSVIFTPLPTGLQAAVNGVSFDRIDRFTWNFGNGDSLTVIPPAGTNLINLASVAHPYTQAGVYFPSLTISNNSYCVSTDTLRLVIAPTVQVVFDSLPYYENFNAGPGNWFQSQADAQAIWRWGQPLGSRIDMPNPAWYLADSSGFPSYPFGESAWVFGPCVDLSRALRPMIRLDYITDFFEFDGVALEYYDETINPDNNQAYGWRSLGNKGQGVSWYNNQNAVFGLLALKRNNLRFDHLDAWTGRNGQPRTARYRLDELRGRRNVRLRLSFASLAGTNCAAGQCPEGFAFDNVWIGERRRNVLVEYFSNFYRPGINTQNNNLYNRIFSPTNALDVQLAQFHTQISGPDSINGQNIPDHNARTFHYGASDAQVVVDGKVYRGAVANVNQWDLDSVMLQDPAFNIQVQPLQINANGVRLQANVQATTDLPQRDYVVYAMVMEDSVRQGIMTNRAVMRKILPNHGSLRFNQSFNNLEAFDVDYSWNLNSLDWANLNPNSLYALVFVQDDVSKEIFQVNSSRNLNLATIPLGSSPSEPEATEEPKIFSLSLYPNPANQQARVDFEALETDYQWQLWDALGRQLQGGKLNQGQTGFDIPTSQLSQGMYFLRLQNAEGTIFVQRQLSVVR